MASSTDKNRNALTGLVAKSTERKTVWLLCLLGVIHVFIFSAAFPLFNLNDEAKHYDLVLKYSHGKIQREVGPMSEEWMPYYSTFATQEYFLAPESLPGKKFSPPLWMLPPDLSESILQTREKEWRTLNHESSQPPLYYLLAGGWWQLGKICGFKGGYLLYWVRFLNLPLMAALVWAGYAAARLVFPERAFLRLGVPAMIAFIPQTVFYSVTNDILSPLCFGLAFICLLRWWQADPPTARQGIALGLALAATFLTKMSNLPVIALAMIFILVRIAQRVKAKKLGASSPSLLWLTACAGIPMGLWAGWCKVHFGDFTGSEGKVQLLGWTRKPIGEWLHHPIFSPSGMWTFVSGLLATLWRGEFLWYGRPLASDVVDFIYVVLSLGLIIVALVDLGWRRASASAPQRGALWFCWWSVVASAAFLGLISIMYDFHNCFYPSREHPYFTSGRLMLGALIPFLLLWLYGLDRALNFTKGERARRLALVVVILFMVTNEVAVDWPVFFSQYNWFHLNAGDLAHG